MTTDVAQAAPYAVAHLITIAVCALLGVAMIVAVVLEFKRPDR